MAVFITGCSSDDSASTKQAKNEYQVKEIEKVRKIEGLLQREADKQKQQIEEQSGY